MSRRTWLLRKGWTREELGTGFLKSETMAESHVGCRAAWQELQREIDSYGGQKDARLKAATAKLKAAKVAAEKARSALKAAEAAFVAATAEGEAAEGERAALIQQLASTKASVAGANRRMIIRVGAVTSC